DFSDEELSSLMDQIMVENGEPFRNVVVHATAAHEIEAYATVQQAGLDLQIFLSGRLVLKSGTPSFEITDEELGAAQLPTPVAQKLQDLLGRAVDLPRVLDARVTAVDVEDGNVSLSVAATPS